MEQFFLLQRPLFFEVSSISLPDFVSSLDCLNHAFKSHKANKFLFIGSHVLPKRSISSSPYTNAIPQSSISFSLCNRVTRAFSGAPRGQSTRELFCLLQTLSTSDRPVTPLWPSATHKKQHLAVRLSLHAALGTVLFYAQSNLTVRTSRSVTMFYCHNFENLQVSYFLLLSSISDSQVCYNLLLLGISVQSGVLLSFTDCFQHIQVCYIALPIVFWYI